ncbi:hypothetical protein [Burkholderia ubonensis]|uniref:hypothetical protein n=1 Tax=Burkholderia ubonensis TaxID=101571 RepID=UPI0010563195|nr:hypothetical protein [Burkholderia ubonensis]
MTYQALTARAERTIRRLVANSRDQAIGALQLWEDLVTEMMAFNRPGYVADRARLSALIPRDDPPAA